MVSKIQEAIKQFLAFTKTETSTPDIYETLKPYTISKTPEASIRAALQKLWKAGEIKMMSLKDWLEYNLLWITKSGAELYTIPYDDMTYFYQQKDDPLGLSSLGL